MSKCELQSQKNVLKFRIGKHHWAEVFVEGFVGSETRTWLWRVDTVE